MNCPDCTENDISEYLAQTDNLWCKFEAEVLNGYLHLVYWCRHCSWHSHKKIDPEFLWDNPFVKEEEE